MERTVSPWLGGRPLRTFGVTAILSTQLLVMVAGPAIVNGTQPLVLILSLCVVSVLVTLYVEFVAAFLRPIRWDGTSMSARFALFVLAAGLTASVLATAGGRGTYAVQVGLAREQWYVAFLTPFSAWPIVGVGFVMWLYRQGAVTRKIYLISIAVTLSSQLYIGFERAIFGQAAAFLATILVMAVMIGIVRLRFLVIAAIAVVLVWPTLYDLRDQTRAAVLGTSAGVSAGDPYGRLQLDKQMSLLSVIGHGDVQGPSVGLLLRTAFVPGALDPNRASLATGQLLSVATGGSDRSATSATFLGNANLFLGVGGVALVSGIIAALARFVIRRLDSSAWAIGWFGLIYYFTLSFNATYPNGLVGLGQSLISVGAAWVLFRLTYGSTARVWSAPVSTGGTPSAGLEQSLRALKR